MRGWRPLIGFAAVLVLAACDLPGTHSQLDVLWSRLAGEGSSTTIAIAMPDARYTAFMRDFPDHCVRRVLMRRGQVVVSAGTFVLIAQSDLPVGDYHYEVQTVRPDCAWEIQTVLNSVFLGPAPTAPKLDIPSPGPFDLTSETTSDFEVTAIGTYSLTHTIVPGASGVCPYDIRLVGPGGVVHRVADGDANRSESFGAFMLSLGHWHVNAGTTCAWKIRLAPSREGGGGGTVGF